MSFASNLFTCKSETASKCHRRAVVAVMMVLAPLCSGALATTNIVDSQGFETGFSLGNLEGQSGWLNSSLSLAAGSTPGTAVVQDSTVESGTQAVRVDRGSRTDDRWAVPVGGSGFPGGRYILIDWDMNVLGTGASSGFGPFFGVDSYRANAGLTVLGTLGVDATTGDVLYQRADNKSLDVTGSFVNFGDWNHFQIRLDFELDQYSVFLNDVFLLSDGFVDGPASTFTDADIAAIAAGGDPVSRAATGTAYFDNFLIREVSPADFDIDGDVDEDDLATLEGAYGSTAAGDTDGDGDTDGADFLFLQREYDGAAPLSAIATIPEPSSLALVLIALSACSRRVR